MQEMTPSVRILLSTIWINAELFVHKELIVISEPMKIKPQFGMSNGMQVGRTMAHPGRMHTPICNPLLPPHPAVTRSGWRLEHTRRPQTQTVPFLLHSGME